MSSFRRAFSQPPAANGRTRWCSSRSYKPRIRLVGDASKGATTRFYARRAARAAMAWSRRWRRHHRHLRMLPARQSGCPFSGAAAAQRPRCGLCLTKIAYSDRCEALSCESSLSSLDCAGNRVRRVRNNYVHSRANPWPEPQSDTCRSGSRTARHGSLNVSRDGSLERAAPSIVSISRQKASPRLSSPVITFRHCRHLQNPNAFHRRCRRQASFWPARTAFA